MSYKKTLENIKSLVGKNYKESNEEALYRHLGLDEDTVKKLEQHSLDMAKEEVKIKVRYINKSDNEDLSYKYVDDSGFDLRANLTSSLIIKPSEIMLVPTGLYFELPESMEIQVRPRSGLAAKNGITVLNTPGTVDRGYSGEIKVILINLGKESFKVNNGDRIAQAVVSPVISGRWAKLIKVDSLDDTDRGGGGFGSTGIK